MGHFQRSVAFATLTKKLPYIGVALIVFGFLRLNAHPWLSVSLILLGVLFFVPLFVRFLKRFLVTHEVLDMLNLGPDPIIVVSEQGVIVASNPAADAMFSQSKESLAGKNLEVLLPENFRDHHAKLRDLFFRSKGEKSMRNAVKTTTVEGNPLEIEVHLKYAKFQGEYYAVASLRDIADFKAAEQLVKQSEKSFRDIFEKSAIGLAHVSLGGSFIRANDHLCQFLGYREEELLSLTFQDITHEEDLQRGLEKLHRALNGEVDQFSDLKRYRHKEGHYLWAKLTTTLVQDELGQPDYFISSIQDISELKETENLLQQSERKLKTIVESISEEMSVWMATPGFESVLYVNEGYEKIWGRSRESLYQNPKSFIDMVHPDDAARVVHHLREHARGEWNIDYRIMTDTGEVRYVHDVGHGIYQDGQLLYLVGTAIDRTEEMERQNILDDSLHKLRNAYQSLADASRHDGLTGVLNRSALFKAIEHAYERYKRYNTPATLAFIDLDRFKEVNDSYGHVVGDQTLIGVARHLQKSVRQTDIVGRYGGDEFIVLLENSNQAQALDFCQRVGSAISVSLNDNRSVEAGLSFGIVELSSSIDTVEQWISMADSKMYGDKSNVQ